MHDIIRVRLVSKKSSTPDMTSLVLASTSRFRRELLARLGLPFAAVAPVCDETPLPGEHAAATARRLASVKARSLAHAYPDALIIGSDQVAVLDGRIIGKPHTHEKAHQQLTRASGASVSFLTGLTLLNSQTGHYQTDCVPFTVHMRELDAERIERYLRIEQPYDCAGSFKSEGLGIALFESIDSKDPTALVGLPLIALSQMLRRAGFTLP